MEEALATLRAGIEAELDTPAGPAVQAFAEAIRGRHGGAAAVLFYGSCLWRASVEDTDSVLDFYLLVDRCRDAYRRWLLAAANRVLPPNVFYLELPWKGRTLRAKYAVVAVDQFRRGTSRRCFEPALWARFAQPARLVYARDTAARAAVVDSLCNAVAALVGRTVPLLGERPTHAALWSGAFQLTYRAELRAERADRSQHVYAANHKRYDRLSAAALAIAGLPYAWSEAEGCFVARQPMAARRRLARLAWAARRVWGKTLNVLRLAKAVFTFEGAVDYMVWKIERHTGVRPQLAPWQRRHPLLAAPAVLWRLYRRGVVR
jgi:hypothetical protein